MATGKLGRRRKGAIFNNNRRVLHASQPLCHSSWIKSHTSPHSRDSDGYTAVYVTGSAQR